MRNELRRVLAHKGRRVQSTTPTESVIDAVQLMNDLRIGALVVLEEGRLVGIFTERDVMTRVVAKRLDPETTRIAEVMTQPVYSMSPSATVEQAMRKMVDRRCRHLPIVDNDELVGIVSLRDLTNWSVREKQKELDQLTGYMYRSYPN